MSNSLRDQLLKVGLVDEEKVKKAEQKARAEARSKNKRSKRKPKAERRAEKAAQPESRKSAEQVLRERSERDAARSRDAARAQRIKEERRARKQQIVEIIDKRRHLRKDGEIVYNFVDGKKVKRIYVTPKLRDGLSAGTMDIVRSGNGHEVVDAEVAQKLAKLDPKILVPRPDRSIADEEAAYADHPIPDDLDW